MFTSDALRAMGCQVRDSILRDEFGGNEMLLANMIPAETMLAAGNFLEAWRSKVLNLPDSNVTNKVLSLHLGALLLHVFVVEAILGLDVETGLTDALRIILEQDSTRGN